MSPFTRLIFSKHTKEQSVYVYENLLHRWLCFDNVYIQTIINKYLPHRPVLKYLPALCVNLQHDQTVTMLGAGAGAIAHYMNHFHPTTHLTLVEKNETIIEIANAFFNLKKKIINKDALDYVKEMAPCDHLFIDIFTEESDTTILINSDFIKNCRAKALECVSFNLLSPSPLALNQLIHSIRTIFKQQTLCLFIKNKSNLIIHAYIKDNYMFHIKHLQNQSLINKPQWFSDKGLVSMLSR